jgi:CubicO group peptidase (beta-lactamase class C family)
VETTPGTAWNYSGGGFMIVQLLLTDVTQQPFPDFLKRHVLDPMGMRNSAFEHPLAEEHRSVAALGYLANDSLVPGGFHVHPELAAAGLWTTPSDLGNWILAMQAAVRGDAGALLTPAMAQAMMTPGLGGWGLGVQIRGSGDTAIFTHGGSNVGYRAAFYGFVHRPSGVVVMTNGDAGAALVEEVAHAVAAEYGWPGFAPHVVTPTHLEPAVVHEWAGTYTQGAVRAIITADDDAPHIRLPGGQLPTTEPIEIIPLAHDRFITADGALTARIVRDASGAVESINIAGTTFKRVP